MFKSTHTGELQTVFYTIIPLLLLVSRTTIISYNGSERSVYAVHITPWFEIGFNSLFNKKREYYVNELEVVRDAFTEFCIQKLGKDFADSDVIDIIADSIREGILTEDKVRINPIPHGVHYYIGSDGIPSRGYLEFNLVKKCWEVFDGRKFFGNRQACLDYIAEVESKRKS